LKLIYVVTEGSSETNFVKRVLVPYFFNSGKLLIPNTVLTKNDHRAGRVYKGGICRYEKAETTISKCLAHSKDNLEACVTTMFDFYRLPGDTPGIAEINSITDPYEKVLFIEKRMTEKESLQKPVYFPYIQLHEFEALLFSDLDAVSKKYFYHDITPLRACVAEKKNPELINNGEQTAPSKRILSCIPDYDKATTGIDILETIGLKTLRSKCPHFNEWITKLEKI
jgi:hypothetical protein